MSAVRYPVVELRQYTLRPGQRDVLIDLFDREFDTFPALPVRTGENVFAWLARFPSPAGLEGHLRQIERSAGWRDRVFPALSALITGAPQQLRLAPTARSQLR